MKPCDHECPRCGAKVAKITFWPELTEEQARNQNFVFVAKAAMSFTPYVYERAYPGPAHMACRCGVCDWRWRVEGARPLNAEGGEK